jgi:hypothetical protein
MPLSLNDVHQATALLRQLVEDRSQLDELPLADAKALLEARSEERRVGKECRRLCRSRWSPYH